MQQTANSIAEIPCDAGPVLVPEASCRSETLASLFRESRNYGNEMLYRLRRGKPTCDTFTLFGTIEDDPDGNVQHIAAHGLTTDEVEYVLENARRKVKSRSSGLPCVFGFTASGDYIIVVYEDVDEDTIRPVTAYPVPGP